MSEYNFTKHNSKPCHNYSHSPECAAPHYQNYRQLHANFLVAIAFQRRLQQK